MIGFTFFFYKLWSSRKIPENNLNVITYDSIKKKGCYINSPEPVIILRIDDVRAYSRPTPYVVNEILKRNISVTLGVIPRSLEADRIMQNYLLSIRDNPHVEIAQHGNEHNGYDREISEESLLHGYNKIVKILRVKPVTYIPPFNHVDKNSRRFIANYFRIISGEEQTLKEERNLVEIGSTVSTYDYKNHRYINNSEIIKKCNESLARNNICVITIHPQEYAVDINNPETISPTRLNELSELLEELENLNANFSTFSNLVRCDHWLSLGGFEEKAQKLIH